MDHFDVPILTGHSGHTPACLPTKYACRILPTSPSEKDRALNPQIGPTTSNAAFLTSANPAINILPWCSAAIAARQFRAQSHYTADDSHYRGASLIGYDRLKNRWTECRNRRQNGNLRRSSGTCSPRIRLCAQDMLDRAYLIRPQQSYASCGECDEWKGSSVSVPRRKATSHHRHSKETQHVARLKLGHDRALMPRRVGGARKAECHRC